MAPAVGTAIAGIAGAGAAIWGAHKSAQASADATRMQIDSSNKAAELEAQTAREALAAQREEMAANRAAAAASENRAYQMWLTKRADLAPYRQLGADALTQMRKPIPTLPPQGGTIGSIIGG